MTFRVIVKAWTFAIGPACMVRAVQFYRACPDGCNRRR